MATREASLLLQAFVAYLRARPADVDTASTRAFDDGRAAMEGISTRPSSLGGVPAVTLLIQVGEAAVAAGVDTTFQPWTHEAAFLKLHVS